MGLEAFNLAFKGFVLTVGVIAAYQITRFVLEALQAQRKGNLYEIDLQQRKIHEDVANLDVDTLIAQSNEFHSRRKGNEDSDGGEGGLSGNSGAD